MPPLPECHINGVVQGVALITPSVTLRGSFLPLRLTVCCPVLPIAVRCLELSSHVYPRSCRWTFGSFPVVGGHEDSHRKRLGASLCVDMRFHFLRNGIVGHVVRNGQTACRGGRAVVHPPQQRARVPVAPHPRQHLLSSVSLLLAFLVSVLWYFIMVLICISLVTNDTEYTSFHVYVHV